MPTPITTSKKSQRKRHRTINEEGNAMTVTTTALGSMSEVDHRSALRRAVIGSTVGTTIEWYDFLLYSTVTGLVFNKVYFPGSEFVDPKNRESGASHADLCKALPAEDIRNGQR
jgi:hypothetical protein